MPRPMHVFEPVPGKSSRCKHCVMGPRAHPSPEEVAEIPTPAEELQQKLQHETQVAKGGNAAQEHVPPYGTSSYTVASTRMGYSAEMLKTQDGKTVPLSFGNGGPVIGKATMVYDERHHELRAEFNISSSEVTEYLKTSPKSFIEGQ